MLEEVSYIVLKIEVTHSREQSFYSYYTASILYNSSFPKNMPAGLVFKKLIQLLLMKVSLVAT